MAQGWYRRLHTKVWDDERFLALSRVAPSGQSLWLWLLLGPHTTPLPGLWRLSRAQAIEDLEWPADRFDECWHEIERSGMAQADWRRKLVWIPKAIEYALPTSPRNVTGWASHFVTLPDCDLWREAGACIRSALTDEGRAAWDRATARAVGSPQGEPVSTPKTRSKPGPCQPPNPEPIVRPDPHFQGSRAAVRDPSERQKEPETARNGWLTPENGDRIADHIADTITDPITDTIGDPIQKRREEKRKEEHRRPDSAACASHDDKPAEDPEEQTRLRSLLARFGRRYPGELERVGRVIAISRRSGEPLGPLCQALAGVVAAADKGTPVKYPASYIAKVLRVEVPNEYERRAVARASGMKQLTEGLSLSSLVEAARKAAGNEGGTDDERLHRQEK